jgi:heptosyltransferase-2
LELTSLLNRSKILAFTISTISNFFFFLIRKIVKLFPYSGGNVVVISLHKIGDSVCTIPAIKEIVKAYKKNITIVCYPENVPIYEYALGQVNVVALEHSDFYFGDRVAGRNARKVLKSLNPEKIFDLTGVMTSASLIFNQRAKKIIGFNRQMFKSIYDKYSTMRQQPHLVDIYLDAVSSFLSFKEDEVERCFPENIDKNGRIVIHPFAGVKSKEWSLINFLALAKNLISEYKVVFIIHTDSMDRDIISEINASGIEVSITPGIKELIDELQDCALLISNDAGPIHVANMLGKATFSIFGPSNPIYSLPPGKNHAFIKSEVSCSPSKEKYCFTYVDQSCPSNECMQTITLNNVEKKVREFISVLGIKQNITHGYTGSASLS